MRWLKWLDNYIECFVVKLDRVLNRETRLEKENEKLRVAIQQMISDIYNNTPEQICMKIQNIWIPHLEDILKGEQK